jgi:hypothetical protein
MARKKVDAAPAPASAGSVVVQEQGGAGNGGAEEQGGGGNGGAEEQGGASDGTALDGAQEPSDATSDASTLAKSDDAGPTAGSEDGTALEDKDQGQPESGSDAAESAAPLFPMRVTLFNHSSASISCRISGAMLCAGGSATVTLHDEEHADAVQKSLMELADANFIPLEKLAVVPA